MLLTMRRLGMTALRMRMRGTPAVGMRRMGLTIMRLALRWRLAWPRRPRLIAVMRRLTIRLEHFVLLLGGRSRVTGLPERPLVSMAGSGIRLAASSFV